MDLPEETRQLVGEIVDLQLRLRKGEDVQRLLDSTWEYLVVISPWPEDVLRDYIFPIAQT